jgi:hypothetical protein
MDREIKASIEMTDEELMDMFGGFEGTEAATIVEPVKIMPLYGIKPIDVIQPLYGIKVVQPLYGIKPPIVIKPLYGIKPMYGIKPVDEQY